MEISIGWSIAFNGCHFAFLDVWLKNFSLLLFGYDFQL